MSKRLVFVVMVGLVALVLVGVAVDGGLLERGGQAEPASLVVPTPGFEGIPEMIVGDQETPGSASSGMPVPGYEDVPEMIVIEE